MFSVFKKKKEILKSPVSGELISLKEVNDDVFSTGMLGPGFAVKPSDGNIYSPVSGTITQIFPTKHAIGISFGKKQLLLHLGIDTVELDGEGFDIKVKVDDEITPETLLVEMDREYIKNNGREDTVIVLLPEETTEINVSPKIVVANDLIVNL